MYDSLKMSATRSHLLFYRRPKSGIDWHSIQAHRRNKCYPAGGGRVVKSATTPLDWRASHEARTTHLSDMVEMQLGATCRHLGFNKIAARRNPCGRRLSEITGVTPEGADENERARSRRRCRSALA